MKILVVGATGATGRLLIEQLLNRGHHVRAVVRNAAKLPDELQINEHLSIIEASLLDLSDTELARTVEGCHAVASCLGHNMSWKGIYGQPRRLVTDAVRRLCKAVKAYQPATLTRFVLMNTAGNSNRDIREPISFSQRFGMLSERLGLHLLINDQISVGVVRGTLGQIRRNRGLLVKRPNSQ